MAKVMGSVGKPVHGAVAAALRRNRGYGEYMSRSDHFSHPEH